jgi:Amt family ammonium transporter
VPPDASLAEQNPPRFSAVPPKLTRPAPLRSMTPGLAFFEAGLLRSRNSISVLMQCWAGLCILSLLW